MMLRKLRLGIRIHFGCEDLKKVKRTDLCIYVEVAGLERQCAVMFGVELYQMLTGGALNAVKSSRVSMSHWRLSCQSSNII